MFPGGPTRALTRSYFSVRNSVSEPPGGDLDQPSRSRTDILGFPGAGGLLGRLRFKHLSLFVALDEHRNLHRAAKDTHLAQPSASKLVQDLELLFGAALFERVPTGMQPTELGKVVLPYARRALTELKHLAGDLDLRRADREGHLSIGATTDLLPSVAEIAIAEIKKRRPTLAVRLLSNPSAEIIDRLIQGRLDVTLGYFHGDPHHAEADYEMIGREKLCIVARHHPFRREPLLTMHALERAAWILHPLMSSMRMGMNAPTNVVECDSLTMTLNLILKSNAATMLPEGLVRVAGRPISSSTIRGSRLFDGVRNADSQGSTAQPCYGEIPGSAAREWCHQIGAGGGVKRNLAT
jgi:DNA-binding transcriptional LysR family regulator